MGVCEHEELPGAGSASSECPPRAPCHGGTPARTGLRAAVPACSGCWCSQSLLARLCWWPWGCCAVPWGWTVPLMEDRVPFAFGKPRYQPDLILMFIFSTAFPRQLPRICQQCLMLMVINCLGCQHPWAWGLPLNYGLGILLRGFGVCCPRCPGHLCCLSWALLACSRAGRLPWKGNAGL